MACLFSAKLYLFAGSPKLVSSHTELLYSRMPGHSPFSSLRPQRTKLNVISSACTRKQTTTLSQDTCDIAVSSRQLYTPVFWLSQINYGPRKLTGYWVGPDEDDCGFTEAFVDEVI